MTWTYYSVEEAASIQKIYSLFETTFDSDYNFPGELHDFWECVYVMNGTICVTADERILDLSAGELIFHKPLELHKFFVKNNKPAQLFIFSFSLSGILNEKIKHKVCSLTEKQTSIMNEFLNYLKEIYNSNIGSTVHEKYLDYGKIMPLSPCYSQMVGIYISKLIIAVSEENSQTFSNTAYDATLFTKTVDYMKKNINTSISVSELAHHVGISESGLQRIFDKYAKMGVHKYFLSLKIKTATSYLESGTGVCETANLLGFSSQNYFSVAYKRETGRNPSIKTKKESQK